MDYYGFDYREDVDGWGERLWDADPDVCCAAFQLGACVHTEKEVIEMDYDEFDDEPRFFVAGSDGDIVVVYEFDVSVAPFVEQWDNDDEPF